MKVINAAIQIVRNLLTGLTRNFKERNMDFNKELIDLINKYREQTGCAVERVEVDWHSSRMSNGNVSGFIANIHVDYKHFGDKR
jgi:hypothetical protein